MWAIEPIFAKLSYAKSDYIEASSIRAVVITLVALVYVALGKSRNLRVTRREFSAAVYVSIVGTLVADLLYYYALTQSPVINAMLIAHLQPVFIVILGFAVLREDKLRGADYAGILLMIGAGLLVTSGSVSNLRKLRLGTHWDLLLIIATIGWSTTAIAMRKYARRVNAGTFTFYRFSVASIVFLSHLAITSSLRIRSVYQILAGIVAGIGMILYYEGLKRVKAAQASALELSTLFFAAASSYLILQERIAKLQVAGIILLLLGVSFFSRKEKVYSKPPLGR